MNLSSDLTLVTAVVAVSQIGGSLCLSTILDVVSERIIADLAGN